MHGHMNVKLYYYSLINNISTFIFYCFTVHVAIVAVLFQLMHIYKL